MATVRNSVWKAQFLTENGHVLSTNYSGLGKKKISYVQPGGVHLSLVFSSTGRSERFVVHPSFPVKGFCRKSRAVRQLSTKMHLEGSHTESSGSETDYTLKQSVDGQSSNSSAGEEAGEKRDASVTVTAEDLPQVKKRSAKIHDFCFGIPFGGIVLGGAVVGFLFSRNQATLVNGLLFGGALLALSYYSLKVWRQGKSSLPFILGQSALASGLLVKQYRMYTLSKKVFPTGFYIIVSAGMLLFYLYVLLAGGNPPPKKLKVATS